MSKILALAFVLTSVARSQQVVTGNYDTARTNANPAEIQLSPSTVTPSSFGQLFSLPVDGQIYAQPLYLQNVTIPGQGTHNVVFTATMHNTVYAFDADMPSTPLWSVNLGPSVPAANYKSDTGAYTDITPENGILGTPVIDPSTGTLYVVAATFEGGQYIYRLHALDIASGGERFNGPTVVTAQVGGVGEGSANGTVFFDAAQHIQRPALLLLNGLVYVSFGSHGDATPFHGWMMGYSAADLRNQVAVLNTTPNGDGGAFWQSGRGPAADENGDIYAVSSNGDTDEVRSFSDNVLRLDPQTLAPQDWFAPYNVQTLDDTDDDLGACGAVLIPGTNYLVTGGKQGVLYLLDRTNLGHIGQNDSEIVQSVNTNDFGIFNMALWNRPDGPLLYLHTANEGITAYQLQGGRLTTSPVAQSLNGFNVPFQGMTVSSSGGTPGSGVLWVLAPAAYPLPSYAILHAYDAESLNELWNSDMPGVGALGGFVKFANPTVANGKVYVPTGANELDVYGIVSAQTSSGTPIITSIVNSASLANGPLAPGEIVEIAGRNLGPGGMAAGAFDSDGMLPAELGGSQVTFNGIPGPLLYTSGTAISAIVPYEVANADQIAVQTTFGPQTSATVNMPAAAAAPGIFSADASGSGPGAILNSDGSLNSQSNPADAGDSILVYATGGGQTDPPSRTGALTTGTMPLVSPVQVTVGGEAAQVLFAGNAEGEVAGTLLLQVQLPADITGTVPIVVTIAGNASPATVTVAVQ